MRDRQPTPRGNDDRLWKPWLKQHSSPPCGPPLRRASTRGQLIAHELPALHLLALVYPNTRASFVTLL